MGVAGSEWLRLEVSTSLKEGGSEWVWQEVSGWGLWV